MWARQAFWLTNDKQKPRPIIGAAFFIMEARPVLERGPAINLLRR